MDKKFVYQVGNNKKVIQRDMRKYTWTPFFNKLADSLSISWIQYVATYSLHMNRFRKIEEKKQNKEAQEDSKTGRERQFLSTSLLD